MKHGLLMFSILTLMLGTFSGHSLAETEGRSCLPEPTDELIEYGDLITCTISPVGDSDLFRFIGTFGETIVIQAADHSGGSPYSPEACIELFNPGGTSVFPITCNERAARKIVPLDQSGEYTIRVTEQSNDQTMNYSLVLESLFPASPSAQPINPGDPPIDDVKINFVGDIDMFVFQGTIGDKVTLKATDKAGGNPYSPEACVELFRPDGTLFGGACHEISAIIDDFLDMSGEWVILVSESSNDQGMDYTLEYQCISGDCLISARPICDIQMSQPTYTDGDTVTAQVFRIANPGPNSVAIEWKVWFEIPSFSPLPFINVGSDGSVVLPPGFDADLGPMPLFPAAGAPIGLYELSCRILNPVTGRATTLDLNPFEIQ